MSEKLLVTIAEAAAMASISRTAAYELVAAGEWPTVTIGKTRKVPVEALRRWVQLRTQSAADTSTGVRPSSANQSAPGRDSGRDDS
jgi:excisionase family DNA binding protein